MMHAMSGSNVGAWIVVVLSPLVLAGSVLLFRWGLRQPRTKRWLRCPNCSYDMRGHVPRESGGEGDPVGDAKPKFICPECGHDAGKLENLIVESPSRAAAIVFGALGICVATVYMINAVGWVIEQPTVNAIEKDGGIAQYRAAPLFGIDRIGNTALLPTRGRVVAVYFLTPNLPSRTSLRSMERLRYLRYVNAYGPGITDAHLVGLARLDGLNVLSLDGTQVTDAGLVPLKQASSLRWLDLSNTKVTGAGLAHLSAMSQLKVLELDGLEVVNADLVHLRPLPQLVSVNLANTQVTDAGLRHLGGLHQLRYLNLANTRVTDEGLAHLDKLFQTPVSGWPIHLAEVPFGAAFIPMDQAAHLMSRTGLSLAGTQVTDQGLVHLKQMKGLELFAIHGTKVTDSGVADLKKALPMLQVMLDWKSPGTAPAK